MNPTIQSQLDHRTIRFFQDKEVPEETVQVLLDVMNRTASSNSMQNASVIRLTDPAAKKKLADICQQAYVADAPEVLIFIVDTRRNAKIAQAQGYEGKTYQQMDIFIQAFTDAVLMAQNVEVAAESLGLGTVFLGSFLNDMQALIELLQLPEFTMPVLGIGFGYPNDQPELKPRMPKEFKIHENFYQDRDDYLTDLQAYDEEMTHYYDTRTKNQRSDKFTAQVLRTMENPRPQRSKYFQFAQQQGFDIGLED